MVISNSLRRKRHDLALVSMLCLCVTGLATARDEPAPVVDAATQSGIAAKKSQELENRITVLERQMDNQALLQLMNRIETLRTELQGILSQVEEQGYNIEGIQKRQRDLYLDIDQRLRKLEEGRSSAPPASSMRPTPPAGAGASSSAQGFPPPAMPASASDVPTSSSDLTDAEAQLERKAYESAFNLLKDGRYDDAIAGFKAFVQTYPNGRYAANAQYWLGEANYVQRRFNDALTEFNKVVKNFPDSNKRSDAMLKLGYTYQELGDLEQARVTLDGVIKEFPSSTAASLAKRRLQDFKQLQ